ncbi:hypothetical protein BT63DRAFT_62241 [Microthyrium microscopicum]|uniref:Uncharacterized protein n=1 Tax=Microthyrium microscopicum TaxID=703497 RepID=A0A6A6U246_9PEZI|nr:hypothetical protein BT63DRAFT_62241 [Microthyrium microscopicum]
MNRYAWMTGEHGMLWNFHDNKVEKPCKGECVILKQFSGLEYANGTEAMIDSGMWLHHMIHLVTGPNRWDPVCYNRWYSSPHFGVNGVPWKTERYFSSGNERSVFNFNADGKDLSSGTGYYVGPDDTFDYLVDLMNMNMEDKVVYLTMTYDILDGPLRPGWKNTKVVWLDADACGLSELPPPVEKGKFEMTSVPWKPNFEGKVIAAVGHLHDGGTDIEIRTNNNTQLCNSNARYAETPQYKFTWGKMGDDELAVDHISSMSHCGVKDTMLSKDQEWSISGKYDFDQRAGNLDHGKQSEVS